MYSDLSSAKVVILVGVVDFKNLYKYRKNLHPGRASPQHPLIANHHIHLFRTNVKLPSLFGMV